MMKYSPSLDERYFTVTPARTQSYLNLPDTANERIGEIGNVVHSCSSSAWEAEAGVS
jgi:predicted GH43/DUF377 family glycosyl hydrolase